MHLELGHSSRDKMKIHMAAKYNIPRWAITIFLKLCLRYKRERMIPQKGMVVRPIYADSFFLQRAQIDLLDLQCKPDRDYYYIFHFQDFLTKFCFLAPLKEKSALEVTKILETIFLTIRAPQILQCDNGSEFKNRLVRELAADWPKCKIIHSRPRHPQSQGSIEKANGIVKKMVRC